MTNEIISTLSSRPIRCAIYARTASEEQAGGSASVDEQIDRCKDSAREMGWSVVESCIRADRAKSGTSLHKCSGLQELLALAATNPKPFDHLVCVSTDRLGRNLGAVHSIVDTLTRNGVNLHFAAQGEGTAGPHFRELIRLATARNYLGDLREEVVKGMRKKAEQGIYPGRAPFGYCHNKTTPGIEVNPENADIVRRVFELCASGRYSIKSLAKEAQHMAGKRISEATLLRILKNAFYIGSFEWKGQTYRGTHPCLISNELYAQVQAVLQDLD